MFSEKNLVIVIPTYNERENIQDLLQKILNLGLEYDVSLIVVDDDSPDGTADIVSSLSEKDKRIHLLLRKGKRGRGTAGIEGFKKASALHPAYIMEMDADFSHRPEDIPVFLKEVPEYDVVIGSRFVEGGGDTDRNLIRRLITFLVRHFLRFHLKIPVKDISSGFRCFKKEVLERIELESLKSKGPSLVQEILYEAFLLGYKIKEVPIVFQSRKKGKTKLNLSILIETFIFNLKLKKKRR